MPHFRDLFPRFGAVGEKYITKQIKDLYLTDCIFILSKLSRHYVKYCQSSSGLSNDEDIYRDRCLELLSHETKLVLAQAEKNFGRKYDIIFPELSVANLIKLCLTNCKRDGYTRSEDFPRQTLESIGESLLVMNSIMTDNQLKLVDKSRQSLDGMAVNFTKQLIADENFDVIQKLYQNYFLFNKYLPKHKNLFDIEQTFLLKYQLTLPEYFAFLFVVYSQFIIKNTEEEDFEMPYFDMNQALSNLKPKYKKHLLEDLLINKINFKKIDKSFYNLTDLSKRPFIELASSVVIPLSLRRLMIGLTDSVYFDILDYLPTEAEKKAFSNAYGHAVEDYFFDLITNFDKNSIREFEYGVGQKTTDAISIQNDGVIFFECKKRQFHNLDFLQHGNTELFYERLNEFFYKPLKQVCDRITDFRSNKYSLSGVKNDVLIYPVIICPLGPPLFSGAWDKLNLDQRVLPELYKTDKNIAQPEFMDFAEFECIEAYLSKNPQVSLVDLIKIKRSDKNYHNANWMVVLQNNNFCYKNTRLQEEYMKDIANFKTLLFDQTGVDNPT
jgi:hypothetical protein